MESHNDKCSSNSKDSQDIGCIGPVTRRSDGLSIGTQSIAYPDFLYKPTSSPYARMWPCIASWTCCRFGTRFAIYRIVQRIDPKRYGCVHDRGQGPPYTILPKSLMLCSPGTSPSSMRSTTGTFHASQCHQVCFGASRSSTMTTSLCAWAGTFLIRGDGLMSWPRRYTASEWARRPDSRTDYI